MKYVKLITRQSIIGLFFLLCSCRPDPTLKGNSYTLCDSSLEISLSFDAHENRYFGKAVNHYYGTYQVQGNSISFSTPASTMYGSDEEDMTAEETYLADLSHVQSYSLQDDNLTLSLPNNKTLRFNRRLDNK